MEKIVIIGAGSAGLMTAQELFRSNFSVEVFEASHRVGGRIYTIEHEKFSIPVDTGAEFIHGDLPLTKRLIKEANIKTSAMSGKSYHVRGSTKYNSNAWEEEHWDKMMKKLYALPEDMTMKSFLDQYFPEHDDPAFYEAITNFTEGYNAADVRTASAFALRDEWASEDEPEQLRPLGGYGKLIDYLTKQIKDRGVIVNLQSKVEKVTWSPNHVMLTLHDGRKVEAHRVVIARPVNLIGNGTLQFDPPIPQYLRAANQIGFGGVIKFIFEFNEAFWEHEPFNFKEPGFIFSDAMIPTWWTQRPAQTPMLTGWIGGPQAKNLAHYDEAELIKIAINSLSTIFKCSQQYLQDHLRHAIAINWFANEYAKGAYSFATLQTANAREILRTPIEGTIYFAGEALDKGPQLGTVEAALSSGAEVASMLRR